MKIERLNLGETHDKALYKGLLAKSQRKLPHFALEYLNSFCEDITKASCFVYTNEKSSSFVLMPGYIRDVSVGDQKTEYFDFVSPYGYYGPVASSNATAEDIVFFWKLLDQWYGENSIVSEFIRFGLEDDHSSYSGDLVPTLSNIKGQIVEVDTQWSNFEHKVRKNVKRAQRENLKSALYYRNISDDVLDVFYDIYVHTMQRNNASEQFYYTRESFASFINNNPDVCAIILIEDADIPIAAELLLISSDTVYSFLGGTLSEYFDKRPNDLLKFEVINWAREAGLKYYVLGGGYGMDDGIFRYKKSFFPNDTVTYYTGRKIINPAAYESLLQEANRYRRQNGLEELAVDDKSFFPLYRKLN